MFALSFIEFDKLAQIFLLQRVVALVFEYAALIRLRFLEPDVPRPMRAPWSWVLGLPTLIIGFFILFFIRENIVWICTGSVEGAFALLYISRRLYSRYKGKEEIWFRRKVPPPSTSSMREFASEAEDEEVGEQVQTMN